MLIVNNKKPVPGGFRVLRDARRRYQFRDTLFAPEGNVFFPTFRAARVFAQQMNAQRDTVNHPNRAVRAGQLNAMSLIDEILRFVAKEYRAQRNPQTFSGALAWVEERVGRQAVDAALVRFTEMFPPQAVYSGEITAEAYLRGESGGVTHRQFMLEELLMLWLANQNLAYSPCRELFDDTALAKGTIYRQLTDALHEYFATQPLFGPDEQPLPEMLRAPAIAVPHSLPGQLEYILTHWGFLLGEYLQRLLSSLDLIREEEKAIFHGPGPSRVYDFSSLLDEPERFSEDRDWMPRLVLLAKNAYVWLDQLSRWYQRAITRLDQIPDEELDTLARRGFSGLWLIGVWQRSTASQTIKQWCGNPEAVASAYSLQDYRVADDLGGEPALEQLKARAWQRGIRLASDMVPNHMGIDSQWVMEHPDWFISLDYSPFPAYSFNGGNLSPNPGVGLYIEDHYYSRSDAAVVFKRVDFASGNTKYIYHGNDGTSMPWNDTAQLNYLIPEVREAVIQTILHVARQFPVIRFDAAMTLAKKHYQRLWFPEPGSGGAIPSRAEHGMTRPEFDAVFPLEFWREVVDRVAQEAPDTLLLAEAFWLMEGYFVRTLGMHRVYNSAFMNMLRDEDNAKYRSVMKNTLEFDPEIMKRYVNFMNNPDERTAVDQFGKDDKYFGTSTMLATLPGLPMFGHGQVEGFSEKYGMEYRRAYWDEQVDQDLVSRHEREIFPLLHRRRIFAEVRNFLLYDFYAPEGHVNEDVFAYSNRAGDERGLIIYHNKFASARGWVRTSVGSLGKATRQVTQRNLGEGLGLHAEDGLYALFRDYVTGLEYIRPSKELFEKGLYVELNAYQYHAFLDFREVRDNVWGHYGQAQAQLNGRGVSSVGDIIREIHLRPIHEPFRALVNADLFRRLMEAQVVDTDGTVDTAILAEVEEKCLALLRAVKAFTASDVEEEPLAQEIRDRLAAALRLPLTAAEPVNLIIPDAKELDDNPAAWGTLFGWLFTHALGSLVTEVESAEQSRDWLDEWMLGKIIANTLQELGMDTGAAEYAVNAIRLLVSEQQWFAQETSAGEFLERLLQDDAAQRLLQINRYEGVTWFNREGFEELLLWLQRVLLVMLREQPKQIAEGIKLLRALQRAEARSEYQVEKLLARVEESA